MASASWITLSEVTTTWISRIAMNMPMHMAANPAQVLSVVSIRSGKTGVIWWEPSERRASIARMRGTFEHGRGERFVVVSYKVVFFAEGRRMRLSWDGWGQIAKICRKGKLTQRLVIDMR